MQQSRNEALKVSRILAYSVFSSGLAIALFAATSAKSHDAYAYYMGQCCVSNWQRSASHHAVNDMLIIHNQTFKSACDAREHLPCNFYLYEFTELNFLSVGSQLPSWTSDMCIN